MFFCLALSTVLVEKAFFESQELFGPRFGCQTQKIMISVPPKMPEGFRHGGTSCLAPKENGD
jgi:hypothetical protein